MKKKEKVKNQLIPSEKLTDDKIKKILDNADLIKMHLKSIEEYVIAKLEAGEIFPGYKLIEGRTSRKFKPEKIPELEELLGDDAYEKSLIGITVAEKKLGKERMEKLTYKTSGKPILVKDTDLRPSIIKLEFEKLN